MLRVIADYYEDRMVTCKTCGKEFSQAPWDRLRICSEECCTSRTQMYNFRYQRRARDAARVA